MEKICFMDILERIQLRFIELRNDKEEKTKRINRLKFILDGEKDSMERLKLTRDIKDLERDIDRLTSIEEDNKNMFAALTELPLTRQ